MWLPLAPRMLWVARCHESGGVFVGGSRCSALFGGAGVAGVRAVWRWSAAQGLRALGCFVDAGWQDLRAVRDSRGPCSEKGPFLARSSRGVFPNSCLQGFSDAWRANLAANWRFSRPKPPRRCMRRKNCHGLPPGNAFREHFAIVERPGTHQGIILPRPDARAAAPQRHALQHRVAMHHDAMRRTRRSCRR